VSVIAAAAVTSVTRVSVGGGGASSHGGRRAGLAGLHPG